MLQLFERPAYPVLDRYARAWATNDLRALVECYHDEVVFHYFGRNPLSGTHRGKSACLAVLRQFQVNTHRQLVSIRDIAHGMHFGVIIAIERLECNDSPFEVERVLRYRLRDDRIVECWVYDEDQRIIDACFAN